MAAGGEEEVVGVVGEDVGVGVHPNQHHLR
jgi:hypothetical protein